VNPKTVIITGSNSGIGKTAAIKFAAAGHKVIMACRSIGRSQEAFNEVLNSSPGKTVELMQLDVSSFQSIRNFCSEFKRKYNVLDVLINNAAFFEHGKKEYQLGPDGIELTFATNTFGSFLLSELLKDVLSKSDDARILNACTENIMHFFDPKRKIELDNLRGEFKDTKKYSVYKNYGDSKMALLMLTFKMAEEYKSLGIKVNAIIIPGVKIAKETIKKMSPGYRLIAMIKQPFSLPPEKLADCYYHICTSDEFFNITGQAVNKHNHVMPAAKHDKGFAKMKELLSFNYIPKYAYDTEMIDKLWNACNTIYRVATNKTI
jgi:NAD(P)-dependent dehydrogenase (short-subunit alcohol dehydrogenase family)